jgi:4-amino-4-deoxy-L-arabinose transferase-like glycosyltransferase
MTRNARAYLQFFLGSFVILLLTHAPVVDLPYFWDELGQFIPAALDIQRDGAWVPKSTLPNVHPPGVMAYLAAVWTLFGYSVTITRVAMLALAAAGVVGTLALGIELCRHTRGYPALTSILLLVVSPLFWAQSMMAQLDMPAMVFTTFGLLLFLQGRYAASAMVCTALVLMKESSLAVPAVFGCWLLFRERRVRDALWFLLPLLAVAGWLFVLYRATGHVLGNPEFTHYNTTFQFHPVRMPVTVVRRLFYLLIDNFHFIGTAAIVVAWKRSAVFRTRGWAVTAGALSPSGAAAVLYSRRGGVYDAVPPEACRRHIDDGRGSDSGNLLQLSLRLSVREQFRVCQLCPPAAAGRNGP